MAERPQLTFAKKAVLDAQRTLAESSGAFGDLREMLRGVDLSKIGQVAIDAQQLAHIADVNFSLAGLTLPQHPLFRGAVQIPQQETEDSPMMTGTSTEELLQFEPEDDYGLAIADYGLRILELEARVERLEADLRLTWTETDWDWRGWQNN